MEPFLSARDARMRLNDTIGLYKGKPVLIKVNQDDPVNTITLTPLQQSQGYVKIKCTDPHLELHQFNMGYANTNRGAQFWSRMPARIQRQGITSENTFCDGERVSIRALLSKTFSDMLMNVYPSYDEALENVTNGQRTSMAFSNEFCITALDEHNLVMYHNCRMIVMYSFSKKTWQFVSSTEQMESFYRDALAKKGVLM